MPKRRQRLEQYKGVLSPAQIAEGMNAAAGNARRLHHDAAMLLREGSYPTAVSLAALSIEESGKLPVLRSLALARDGRERKGNWREYRSHTSKNVMWPFLDLVAKGGRRLADFRGLFEEDAEHPSLLDNIKQLGFYTDCLGTAHWSVPSTVIGKDLAQSLVTAAEILLPKRRTTEKEIELWIKHLRPVWKGNMEFMEAAVTAWHREMCDEGLLSGDPDAMEKFIIDGLSRKPGASEEPSE